MIDYQTFAPDAAAEESVRRALAALRATWTAQGRLESLPALIRGALDAPDPRFVHAHAADFASHHFVMLYAAETDCPALFRLRIDGLGDASKLEFFLNVAGRLGAPAVIRLLAARGADLNAGEDDGLHRHTALHWAAYQGHAAAVAALLEQPGLELETRDGHGTTALTVAVDRRRLAIAEMLIGAGARFDPECALRAFRADGGGVEFAIRHLRDLNFLGPKSGIGPLHAAIAYRAPDAARRLLAAGADPELRSRRQFKRPGVVYPAKASARDYALLGGDRELAALLG